MGSYTITTNNIWRILISISIMGMLFLNTTNIKSSVDSNNNETELANQAFGDQLCKIVNSLQGNIARAIATVAIFALGLGFFSGRLDWQTTAITACGIITIFSAGTIVKWLGGVQDGECD